MAEAVKLDPQLGFFQAATWGMYALAVVTVITVSKIVAPYGRHTRGKWGPRMSVRDGWMIFESPALWCFLLFFWSGQNSSNLVPTIFLRIFQLHYVHRVVIYPFRMKTGGKSMPVIVAVLGLLFNIYNSYLQASQIGHYGKYPASWVKRPCFAIGSALFALGFVTNVWADSVLLSLRRGPSDRSYKIPHGLLYEYISCPNYFGEMVEWLGWAVMTWSWAGLAFFVYTAANLGPRALANHDWYLKRFENYPKSRKALIPFLL